MNPSVLDTVSDRLRMLSALASSLSVVICFTEAPLSQAAGVRVGCDRRSPPALQPTPLGVAPGCCA